MPGILPRMADVTEILKQINHGDPAATERLLPLVYQELKKLAAAKMIGERPDHTLQATALVHEAYLRLVDAQQIQQWESRSHFFCAAAEAGFIGSLKIAGRSILASMESSPYTTDTSREAFAVQLDCLRKMTPQERIRKTCAMSRQVRKMAFEAIRRRHPEFDDREVQLLFIELTYGKPLASEVRRWQAERPA